jgi:hypothetical protein
MLKLARADYRCQSMPPTKREALNHIVRYMRVIGNHTTPMTAPAGYEVEGGARELAEVLWQYTAAVPLGTGLQATLQLHAVAKRLAAPDCKRRLQHQLEPLAGGEGHREALLTLEQLQYSCCFAAIKHADDLPQPTAEQLAELKAAAAWCVQTLRQLEPNNPKTHYAAVDAQRLDLAKRDYKQAAKCHLRAFELAKQQRSDAWMIHSASNWLVLAACHPLDVGHSTAAFEQTAEAALRRCRRLLPEVWVQGMIVELDMARSVLPGAREQLQLLQQQQQARRRGPAVTGSEALLVSAAAQVAALREQAKSVGPRRFDNGELTNCDGCGQEAVGLRRCARCKKAQYCRYGYAVASCSRALCVCLHGLSRGQRWQGGLPAYLLTALFVCHSWPAPCCSRECQVAHWSAHKHECVPA